MAVGVASIRELSKMNDDLCRLKSLSVYVFCFGAGDIIESVGECPPIDGGIG